MAASTQAGHKEPAWGNQNTSRNQMNKQQVKKLNAQWNQVGEMLDAMRLDANATSLIDMEVGSYEILRQMNEMRRDHNVRPHRFSDAILSKLAEAAQAVSSAVADSGTSTSIQTAIVGLLGALMTAEIRQDEERMPLYIQEMKARYMAEGYVVVDKEDGFSIERKAA
jgi:hypothetical protein